MVGILTKCLNLYSGGDYFISNALLNSHDERMKLIFLAIELPSWQKDTFDVPVALSF
jgi:hypothetical protein